jgi:hypothetical protein
MSQQTISHFFGPALFFSLSLSERALLLFHTPKHTQRSLATTVMMKMKRQVTTEEHVQEELKILDSQLAEKKERLVTLRRHRASQKAQYQNELLKLRSQCNKAKAALAEQFAFLTLKKKDPTTDLAVYRQAVAIVFAETYLPAFCIAKQASLLRAVHYMICFDQALQHYKQQCIANLGVHDLNLIQQQDESAVNSQEFLNRMLQLDHEIQSQRLDMALRQERLVHLDKAANRPRIDSYSDGEGDESFDEVSLVDDSVNKGSNHTEDTVSFGWYSDGDSCDDESGDSFLFNGSSHSIPQLAHG